MDNTNLHILNQAFNQMSDISILFQVVNNRFIFIKANQSAYHAGFLPEFYGKFVEEVLPPKVAGPLNNLLNRAYTTKEYVRFTEILHLRLDNLLGDIALTPILDENEKCTHIIGIARDITESKHWEEELVQSSSLYDTILFSTTDAILITNSERIILRVNNGFTSLFGWEAHEVIGLPLNLINLVPNQYLEEHEVITKNLLEGNNIPSYRTLRNHKDGRIVPVNVSYSTLKAKDGLVLGSIIIYRDITKQVEVEQQLESEKQRYQSLVENHPDAVIQFDLEGNFTNANHAVENLTGYQVEELLHQSFIPLIADDKITSTLENFKATLEGNTSKYESEAIHKSGERVVLDVTNVPMIVNGEITGVFGIARNITEQKKLENELIHIKERLESFVNNTSDAINIMDLDARVTYINPAFESIYGYSKEDILGNNISIIQASSKLNVENLVQRIVDGEKIHDMEVVQRRKDGTLIDISFSLSPIRNEKGDITLIAAISRNITEKKEVQRRLKDSEEKYRIITENMTDLISIYDPNMIALYVSPSHKNVLGLNIEEGTPFQIELIHEDDISMILKKFKEVAETKTQVRFEFRIRHADGHFVWLDIKLTPILDEQGNIQHTHCVSRDISERKNYEFELEKMAFFDFLTGAPNRRLFMERLEQTIAISKRTQEDFTIMAMDFDRFKWVNDQLGHAVGDELLVQFVQRVKSCIRDTDTIARLGGDEFAILIPGISTVDEVGKIAERILEALQEPWHIFGNEFITTSSIGICMSQCGRYDTHSLMKHADQTLYKAKQSGRNNYQFCNFRNEQYEVADSVETFERDIKRAIANNEFYLVYQPKFNLSSKNIVSIEALIRWEHPEKGLIVPDKFIPRAEEMNLIEPITKWVLFRAGKEAKRWENVYGKAIPVSINISPKHFETGTIIKDVKDCIQKTGIEPQNLILEITENAMIKDMDCTLDAIQQLKNMGVKIAIDDFGTGFSSLSYLMKLDVDILKLDKTFVQEELTSKKNASLVFSIVSLAHNLNLEVVAEGIETEQQCHVLNQYGCDIGQGYYFSKPLTGEQIEKVFLQK